MVNRNGDHLAADTTFTGFLNDQNQLVIRKGKVAIGGNNIVESTSNYGLLVFLQALLDHYVTAKKAKLALESWYQGVAANRSPTVGMWVMLLHKRKGVS